MQGVEREQFSAQPQRLVKVSSDGFSFHMRIPANVTAHSGERDRCA